ncbi:MAG: DUF6550 family protein [Ethanoligenens sp.]
MKLTDKTKKRLTLAGLGVLSVVLIVAIAAQFRTGTPADRQADASSAASDASVPSISAPGATGSSPDVSVPAVSAPDTASQNGSAKDTGDSSGTNQSIQAEVTKPSAPSAEAKTDPNRTPDGKKASKTDNGTPTADPSKPSTPKSGDKKDGKIYVPGFGWIEDNGGGGSGKTAGDMYENGNKIGNMN